MLNQPGPATPQSTLTAVGSFTFIVALAALLGRHAEALADFHLAYGWVPLYCIFAFFSGAVGLVSIALGARRLAQIAGVIVALHAAALLLGSLGIAGSWFEHLLMEYTGQTPFALLSSVRTVIICNFSLGFALLLMGMQRSFPQRGLVVAFLGALIIGLPLSEAISYVLKVRTNSDVPLSVLAVTTSVRVSMGWAVIAFAYHELRSQLHLARIPVLPLALVVSMLTVSLIVWRALIAEGEQRLREAVHSRMEHVKAEIVDGLSHCFQPIFGMADDWAREGVQRPREPQLHLVHHHREGLEFVEAFDNTGGRHWRASTEHGSPIEPELPVVDLFETGTVGNEPILSRSRNDQGLLRLALAVSAHRADHTYGFLVASYRVEELFRHILHEHALRDIELTVFDGDASLYANRSGEGVNRWMQESTLEVYGRTWRLRLLPAKGLVADSVSTLPWVVLFTGSLLTLALVWVYYLARLAHIRVQHLAHEVGQRQRAEAKLYKLNDELERRVRERTHELANEKELLAVTMESIGDGVIATDTDGVIRSMNHVAEQMTGWSRAQAVGQGVSSVFRVFDPATRQALDNPVKQALGATQACSMPHKSLLLSTDGKECVIDDSAAPILDRQGRVLGAVLVFKDITESQKMEEELFRSRNLEAIGLLAGGIAHDFNNILTGITANVSLAKLYAKPGEAVHTSLAEAEKAFARARDLTLQLLTFSRGGAPIRKSASVAELLQDTASFVLRGSNVRADINIAADLWAASIDPGQISQAMNNLLINAMQAMPGGGTIFVTAHNRHIRANGKPVAPGDYVEIVVRDQGSGIAPENQPRIFEPYFTTKKSGTGLGLATTYSIIKRHNGYIEVESSPGEGTTFRVYLPAAQGGAPVKVNKPVAEDLRGWGRVLVMDDDRQIRDVAARTLAALGYEVEVAASGEETVDAYHKSLRAGSRFDAVILDLTVPGRMGGMECLQHLRALDPAVRAIVSSGYSNDPILAEYARHGFRAVVAKPYVLEELATSLREVLTACAPPAD